MDTRLSVTLVSSITISLMSARENVLPMTVSDVPSSYVISPVCDAGNWYVTLPDLMFRVCAPAAIVSAKAAMRKTHFFISHLLYWFRS